MTDLLTIYDVLTLPAGAQLVSDHGAVALLLVTRESPDKVTIERVPLGTAVSLLDAIQAAQQRGVELFTPSVSVIAQQSAGAAPKALADGGSWNAGKTMEKQDCQHCGRPIATTQLKRHERACPERPELRDKALPAPLDEATARTDAELYALGHTECAICHRPVAPGGTHIHDVPEPVQSESEPATATTDTQACAGCGILFGPDHVEQAPYEIVNGQPRCETCATGSVYGRRRAA